jgi:hypothetical protein
LKRLPVIAGSLFFLESRMRLSILLAGPALSLAACGTNGQADNTINADASLSAESFSSNDVTAIDAVTGDASNMAADINYVDELNDLGDGDGGGSTQQSAPARGSGARRSANNATDANAAIPEPTANSTAAAPANNAI